MLLACLVSACSNDPPPCPGFDEEPRLLLFADEDSTIASAEAAGSTEAAAERNRAPYPYSNFEAFNVPLDASRDRTTFVLHRPDSLNDTLVLRYEREFRYIEQDANEYEELCEARLFLQNLQIDSAASRLTTDIGIRHIPPPL